MPNGLFAALVGFARTFGQNPEDPAVQRRVRPVGRVTRWKFPEEDRTIAELPVEERRVMAEVWAGRCSSESGAASAFDHVAESLQVMRAPEPVVNLARRAVTDERRHIEICRRVASAYRGERFPSPRERRVRPPMYDVDDPGLQALLRVTGQCCLNETTACAYARCSFAGARAPLVRAALREILADEIDHARTGWAALATAPAELREGLGRLLPNLIEHHLSGWFGSLFEFSPVLVAHGMPSRQDAEEAVIETLEETILPGFEALGVPVHTRRFR